MADKKDKELSTNAEVKRSDAVQDRIELKTQVLDLIKELLDSTTEEAFSKLGYERVEKHAGVYGTGKEYGSGAEEDKYQIRLAGKTKTNIEKQIVFGAKRIESEINLVFKDGVLNLEYKTPESGFFRGVEEPWTVKTDDKGTNGYMINLKSSFKTNNLKTLKKELSNFFKKIANQEVGYLSNTKLGVEDKLEKSTTSTVEENFKKPESNDMEKLTLKEFFFEVKESKIEPNIPKIKSKNTIPLKDVEPQSKEHDKDKFIFFDGHAKELEELYTAKYSEMGKDEYVNFVKDEMKKKFGTNSLAELTPVEKKELFNHIDRIYTSKEEMGVNEVTASGPSGTGAGAYLTPMAWKPVGMLKGVKETSYGKQKNSKRPKVDKDWNVVPEGKDKKDSFWTPVKVDPNYHPLGMPFVKPNSKGEWKRTVHGDKDKMKRMGLAENSNAAESQEKHDLTKKKFFYESENRENGVNKRYLITEKTSEEYQKERWNKLATFKLYESIKEAEEIHEDLDGNKIIMESVNKTFDKILIENNDNIDAQELEQQIYENNSVDSEELVFVQKPSSLFGTEYKFYKKDFLNEAKKYILDLNSMVFVPNPNSK